MKRRTFLGFSAAVCFGTPVFGTANSILRRRFRRIAPLVDAVLRHMFPPASPLAANERLTAFIEESIFHPRYDRDIRRFVIEGAERLRSRVPSAFASLSPAAKERLLRDFERDAYGKAWLRRMLILGLEGLLSDPIYGANVDARYWKALHTKGGLPRPKRRYIWG
jgi:hypothetical protein